MAFMEDYQHLQIKLKDIKSATNNFSEENYMGGGGFGKVYKGEVSHFKGRNMVAFKRLDRKHGQGDAEFWKEIKTLCSYKHENLISLLGFCNEDHELILVYEYACYGSLDKHLNNPALTWRQRLKICLDVAKAIEYLHDPKGTHKRVIHCDIKSGNILLFDNWVAKLADLGLSKMGPANQDQTFLISSAVGTLGYCDPMYMKMGFLTKESDVYSFGVLLFEVLYGRPCFNKIDNGWGQILVPTWKQNYVENKIVEFYITQEDRDPSSLKLFSDIAYRCLKVSRENRPKMAEVVIELEIALENQEMSEGKTQMVNYKEMVKTAVPPLNYRSEAELMIFLSNGVLINGGTTWFSSNDKGQHIEMISIAHCMTNPPQHETQYHYTSEYNSRFKVGTYQTEDVKFTTRVRTQFLSPHITYTVNLVFKFENTNDNMINLISLRHKLKGDTETSVSYLSYQREDGWSVAELYLINTDRKIVDFEILFNGCFGGPLQVEGIEFRPILEVEEPITFEDDPYWKDKLPDDTTSEQHKINKELYSIVRKGFLLDGGQEWLFLDKNGKICLMLSASAVILKETEYRTSHCYLKSRFGEVLEVSNANLIFFIKIESQILSPQTAYASYLVYSLPEGDDNKFKHLVKVVGGKSLGSDGPNKHDFWYVYFFSHPTPLIVGGKVDQNARNSFSRRVFKGIPQLRNDGWMEVQLFEFQTSSDEMIPMHLELKGLHGMNLKGVIIQGIEFRPI